MSSSTVDGDDQSRELSLSMLKEKEAMLTTFFADFRATPDPHLKKVDLYENLLIFDFFKFALVMTKQILLCGERGLFFMIFVFSDLNGRHC